MTNTSGLDVLNEASDERAAELLSACNASPRWIERLLADRPYVDVESVLRTGERAARSLDWM